MKKSKIAKSKKISIEKQRRENIRERLVFFFLSLHPEIRPCRILLWSAIVRFFQNVIYLFSFRFSVGAKTDVKVSVHGPKIAEESRKSRRV